MLCGICFTSSYLFIYPFFLILTLLQYFVALIIPFCYEKNKHLYSIEQRTTDASIDQWHSQLKNAYVPKADIIFNHMTEINLYRKTKK